MSKSYSDIERHKALQRARKFEILFNGECFDKILDAAHARDEAAFRAACRGVPAVQTSEVDWLWNYLQHIDENKWKAVPDLATTGW